MTSTDGTDGAGEVPIDILLVEPSPGDSRLFEESFREAKLANAVHVVDDGDAALDFLAQRGAYEDAPEPDVVLLEPTLPGTSGGTVLETLRNEPALGDVAVVVLTSSDTGEAILRSRGPEADAYVRKPIGPEDFVRVVQEVEEFWFAIVRRGDGGEEQVAESDD